MGFLGISLEMAAVDAGMKDGIVKAAKALDDVNKMLIDQDSVIKKIKKENFFEDIEKNAGKASNKVGILSKTFSKLGDIGSTSANKIKSSFDKIRNSVMQFNIADMASNVRTLTGRLVILQIVWKLQW